MVLLLHNNIMYFTKIICIGHKIINKSSFCLSEMDMHNSIFFKCHLILLISLYVSIFNRINENRKMVYAKCLLLSTTVLNGLKYMWTKKLFLSFKEGFYTFIFGQSFYSHFILSERVSRNLVFTDISDSSAKWTISRTKMVEKFQQIKD